MEVSGKRPVYSEEGDTGIPCDPCLIDNVNEKAQLYCTNCDEFLCDTCARNHKKYKASRQHQILNRDEMPSKKLSIEQDKFCATHDGKLIEYLCKRHDTFCCTMCVTLFHVQCGVECIDDMATEFSTSQAYMSLLKQIKDIEKQLLGYKNKTLKDLINVTNCFEQLKAEVQIFRIEINSEINALEDKLMQQAEKIKNEDLKAIESLDTLNSMFLEDMSEIVSTLRFLESCKQNKQLFISSKKAEYQVKTYNDTACKMSQENIVRMYAFSRNENILNTINSPSKLGSLEMKTDGDERTAKREKTEIGQMGEDNPTFGSLSINIKEKRGDELNTKNEKKTMKTDIFKPTKFQLWKNIKIKHQTDKREIWVSGSVLMSNDTLALAQFINKSIKVVDLRSDTIKCYLKLDDPPWDITCMDLDTLVVTCDTYLVFLHYNGTLSVVKKVPMESGCTGITYRKGKLFVTFSAGTRSVKILDHEGNVFHTLKHNDKGRNLFSCPEYITVNSDGDTMYVSDVKQNTVTSLSMGGKVCNIYKHESLSRPKGLTLGADDSIYVSGYGSQNIHQITSACTTVRIVLDKTDGLNQPRTVSYNNTDQTLYVSNHSPTDPLIVYKLN